MYHNNYRVKLFPITIVPASSPQAVEVTAADSRTLFISWSPPPDEDQNGIIREYRINITEVETGMVMFLTTSDTDTLVSPLHPAYTYKCTVSAYTVAEGPRSEVVSTTLPEDGMYLQVFCHCI